MDDIFLYIYVLIDDLYPEHATEFRKGQPGQKPEFSDSEVMTVMIAMDIQPIPDNIPYQTIIVKYVGLLRPCGSRNDGWVALPGTGDEMRH
jgi:hypothetical protein